MKLAYVNLGCPKNQIDLERILGGVLEQTEVVDDAGDADAVLINTCAFIESAKLESIETIFAIAQLKAQKPALKVLVSGCLPQRYRDELQQQIPEVDRFFDTLDADQTTRAIQEYLRIPYIDKPARYLLSPSHYAYLQLAQGCNNRCSYCAIPLIKGDFASRPRREILNEAEQLVQAGAKELILVAQDSTFYGRDLPENDGLTAVLNDLNDIRGLEWIRLMYTHPAHWRDDLIDAVAGLEHVVKYVDMPIQHASDAVLKRMGRLGSRKQLVDVYEKLQSRIPNLAIRTTVINGFPGETESEHQELLQFLADYPFQRLGSFTYSPEEGTRAFKMNDDVPEDVKLERQQQVMEQQIDIAAEWNEQKNSSIVKVLVDEIDYSQNTAFGRTQWDAPEIDNAVLLPANDVEPGHFYTCRVTAADVYDLFAEVTAETPAPSLTKG